MIITRPRRLDLRRVIAPLVDLRTVSLDAPLPITLTCKGMGLAWPSGSAETGEDALLDYSLQLPPVPSLPPSMLCAVCGIANIHGPRCFGSDCPRRITR
jgi:hypothetical protein